MSPTLTLSGRTDLNQEHVTHVHAQFPQSGTGRNTRQALCNLATSCTARGELDGNGWIPYLRPADTLCTIESIDLANAKASYLQAQVQLKLDKENLVRTEELLKSQILAKKYLLDAEAAVTKDSAVLDAARQQCWCSG